MATTLRPREDGDLLRPRAADRANGQMVAEQPTRPAGARARRWIVVGVTVALLSATAVLSAITAHVVDTAEDTLLEDRALEGAVLLRAMADGRVVPIRTAAVVSGPDADGQRAFRESMSVLLRPVGSFDRAMLLGPDGDLLVSMGEGPTDLVQSEDLQSLLAEARDKPGLVVTRLIHDQDRRALGLAASGRTPAGPHVVYAELPLPSDPTPARPGEAFDDVHFALHFTSEERPDTTLFSSTDRIPLQGHRSVQPVRFGNRELTLVVTPRHPLLGTVTHQLPWIVATTGLLVTIAAGLLFDTVARRRDAAVLQSAVLEREVDARTAALSAANQELESFAYSVSHDLRAPLRAVDGFTLAVLDDPSSALAGDSRSDLLRVRRAAQRMGDLIDDVLALSRVVRLPLRIADVDLSAEVRSIVEHLRATDPERSVTVVIEDGLHTPGDAGLIRLALENLVSNAWKFTRETPQARIEFGATRIDGRRAYYLRDNGVGFDPIYAEKLFQPFQRLHDPARFEGSGVGLATVSRVLDRHNGEIWAEAAEGRGATFFFTLPAPGREPW